MAAQPPVSAVTAVTEAAVRGGVLACARRIEQVMKFLTAGTANGAILSLAPEQPDQNVFSVSLEVARSTGAPAYVTASFFPNADGGCSAVYDSVEYSTHSCVATQKIYLPAAKPLPVIMKDIGILEAGTVKVFFVPVNNGCAVVKKEVVN